MRRHWQYLKYVMRHKWFVFIEGIKIGVPIHLLILHDISKFRPGEWFTYARTFYSPSGESQYQPGLLGEGMSVGWNHHQKRNKHHWQYWMITWDKGNTECLPMPDRYRAEMLADWRGAGRALGFPDTRAWYAKNRDNIKLHPDTRRFFDVMLKYLSPMPEVEINA